MRQQIHAAFVVGLLLTVSSIMADEHEWISIFPGGSEAILREEGALVWMRQSDLLVGSAPDASIERLSERGITPIVEILDGGQWMYLLHHRAGFALPPVPDASIYALTSETALYLFPRGSKVDLPRVKPDGAFQGLPRTPLPRLVTHPADLAATPAAPSTYNPLVAQILGATSQSSWFQFVRDLTGDSPVFVSGQTRTITTRYSDAMFPTPAANAYATEYLEERGASWGYTPKRESYTSADSGCDQSNTWQNLTFTVPGQVDFGKHQQVLFVNHYDSISPESFVYAPGADDAMSGGSALLEAMRTFKGFAFKNTLVFAFFSAEEVGLCGSSAYVRQHPTADMWRAVNMDQTAFDGDGNRLMDVYNWDPLSSPGSVALGDAFVEANTVYGNIIPPGNIVRDVSGMCQTDHCPFWNVGVPAIAITEDLHNHDICPCFDLGQTSGCHDTVTQMYNGQLMFNQDYSWPSEKAAIALIAQLAEPLYACPAAAVAAPVVMPSNKINDLTWTAAAGVTNYVIERAATCGGPIWTAIASVNGTSFEDTGLANGTSYAYRIRTCPAQVSACATATPAAGPSAVYQSGSASIVADSGDHDAIADNCELTTLQLNLVNDGNVPLTNVRLAAVTASSAAVHIASALPQLVGSLGVGAAAPAAFKFYLARDGVSAACGDPLTFTVTATSDQSAPAVRSFTINAERSTSVGPLTYGFETDFGGWELASGSVTVEPGGAPGSIGGSLHFRTGVDNDCNAMVSPILKPSATSTLSMYVNYVTQSTDRANVRVVDTKTGGKTLLTPTGAVYSMTPDTWLLCDNLGNLRGWSGSHGTWRLANFNLSPYAGKEIRLEARESTNTTLNYQGFWMDLVQVTNATQIDCDLQSDSCAALPPEVSPAGDPVPLTIGRAGTDLILVFSESLGATRYNVYTGSLANLARGIYDHAAAAGLCGFVDGAVGDGSVAVTVADAAIPDNSYVLAVASAPVGESKYGTSSTGADIPLALESCP